MGSGCFVTVSRCMGKYSINHFSIGINRSIGGCIISGSLFIGAVYICHLPNLSSRNPYPQLNTFSCYLTNESH